MNMRISNILSVLQGLSQHISELESTIEKTRSELVSGNSSLFMGELDAKSVVFFFFFFLSLLIAL